MKLSQLARVGNMRFHDLYIGDQWACTAVADYANQARLCFQQLQETIRLSAENADNLPFLLDELTKIANNFPTIKKE